MDVLQLTGYISLQPPRQHPNYSSIHQVRGWNWLQICHIRFISPSQTELADRSRLWHLPHSKHAHTPWRTCSSNKKKNSPEKIQSNFRQMSSHLLAFSISISEPRRRFQWSFSPVADEDNTSELMADGNLITHWKHQVYVEEFSAPHVLFHLRWFPQTRAGISDMHAATLFPWVLIFTNPGGFPQLLQTTPHFHFQSY